MSDQNLPPLHPGFAEPLKWPKIIGILSIVFAAFSFFGSIMSMFTGKMLRFQMTMGATHRKVDPEAIEGFLSKWHWYFVAGGVSGAVMGLLLIFGGIMLLKGRKISRPLFLAYAIISILYSAFAVYITLGSGMIDEQMAVMFGLAEGESLSKYPEANIGRISGIVGGVVGGVFAMILPLFLLIWFMRNQVKMDVATRFN